MRTYSDTFELIYTLKLYTTVLLCFLAIYLFDTCVSFFDKNFKRRWYVVHAVINLVILCWSFPDFIHTLRYPLDIVGYDIDFYPISWVIALHWFHIFKDWKNMDFVDWMHHLISAFVVPNLVMYFMKGSLVNYMLVFMCGLPGGIDYVLLALTKYGIINRMREKKINTFLNNWIRAPGILHACSLGIVNMAIVESPPFFNFWIGLLLVILNFYNAVYFAERVTLNYGKRQIIEKYKKEIGNNTENEKFFN